MTNSPERVAPYVSQAEDASTWADGWLDDPDCAGVYIREDVAIDVCRKAVWLEVAEWIRTQRNDVPATGYEFANAIAAAIMEDTGQ